jgi:hypothetical protein
MISFPQRQWKTLQTVLQCVWLKFVDCLKKNSGYLKPVISATQQVEIRRIMVGSQAEQKVRKTPSQPISWV